VVLGAAPLLTVTLALARRPGWALLWSALQAARSARRLGQIGLPRALAGQLAARAALHGVVDLGRLAGGVGAPVALTVAAGSARARRPIVLLTLLPALREWRERRPALDPLRWLLAARVDDAAYAAGVWWGALRARTVEPLRPRFSARILAKIR
jgi:hypothetical protein